jgi:hypothetical protein
MVAISIVPFLKCADPRFWQFQALENPPSNFSKEKLIMKRIFPVFLVLGLILGLWSSQSLAYTQTFQDETLVQASGSGSGYTGGVWYDIIGGNEYDISKIEVTWNGSEVIIDIHTNTSGNRIGTDYVADVALDLDQNGVWETGIVLKNDDRSSSYNVNTMYTFGNSNNNHWQISDEYPGGVYGTNYDRSNNPNQAGAHDPYDPPVLLKTTATPISDDSVTVNWEADGSPTPYLLTLTLTGVNAGGDWNSFDLLWATQTCANDTQYIQATVPIPGSLLLLGTGILGLGLLGWRRKRG